MGRALMLDTCMALKACPHSVHLQDCVQARHTQQALRHHVGWSETCVPRMCRPS